MYIFVCSPGRSGTKYLSELFKNYTNIPSFHGGEKDLRYIIDSGAYRNNNSEIITKRIDLIKKLKNINGYFESGQIFIHRLINYLLLDKSISPIYVINTIRNPIEVAVSYENRNSLPSNNNNFWRLPLDKNNRIINITQKLTLFQENLFDWIDTQMKFELYKNKFNKIYTINFNDISNKNEIIKMFNYFNIKYNKDKLNDTNIFNLEKNENNKKTIIQKKHIEETKQLINILKKYKNYPENIINKYINPFIL